MMGDITDKKRIRVKTMPDMINETSRFLLSRIDSTPTVGMITGTGLGSLTENMHIELRMAYERIPHFPKSTTEGHRGNLVFGKLSDRAVVALEGRFHMYEGYSPQEVAFPVQVMASLGVKHLLISSAAGGLNPLFKTGELMAVTDHINLTGKNPLVGPNMNELGPRFPDMSRAYDSQLVALAEKKALEKAIPLRKGVYVAVMGPSLETPAETRFLRLIGGDAVGMSTVVETIAGAHCGMKVIAIVVITNVNLPDRMSETSLEEVISAAQEATPTLRLLWDALISELP